MPKLSRAFYTRNDVVQIAQELLGKYLFTNTLGEILCGIITETEAYCGRNDKACHANDGLRTKRTEVMYHEGGKAYVYLCYGIHHLFNVVTNQEDLADAVLIRAVQPVHGIETMLQQRNMEKLATKLTAGPGSLSKAMGISTTHYGVDLLGDEIWISDTDLNGDPARNYSKNEIIASPRVGVDYAKEDALKPWRFRIKNNKWTSPVK